MRRHHHRRCLKSERDSIKKNLIKKNSKTKEQRKNKRNYKKKIYNINRGREGLDKQRSSVRKSKAKIADFN